MARSVNDAFKWKMQRECIEGFLNLVLTKPNLASGETSGKIGFTEYGHSFVHYTIGGKFYSANIVLSFTPAAGSVGFSNVASGKARLYAVCLTSDASMVLWGGAEISAGSANVSAFCGSNVPSSQCVIGTLLISNAATTSWAIGSNVGSTNNVFTDCFMIPQSVLIRDA